MKVKNVFFMAVVAIAFVTMNSACNKKKDTIGKVFVYDENKNAISNCDVVLLAVPTDPSYGKSMIANDTATTNLSGEAIFNFNELYELGQAGVAVLNIKVEKDGLIGNGVIQIIEEETSEATVYIK